MQFLCYSTMLPVAKIIWRRVITNEFVRSVVGIKLLGGTLKYWEGNHSSCHSWRQALNVGIQLFTFSHGPPVRCVPCLPKRR